MPARCDLLPAKSPIFSDGTEAVRVCLDCNLVKCASDFYFREGYPESYCKLCKKTRQCPDRISLLARKQEVLVIKQLLHRKRRDDRLERQCFAARKLQLKREAGFFGRCQMRRSKDQQKAKRLDYDARTADHQRMMRRKWDKANPEKRKEKKAKSKAKNPHLQSIYAKRTRERNPVKYKELAARNHHRRRAAKHNPYTFSQIHEEWKGLCVICEHPVDLYDMWVEHMVPISRGGNDVLGNVGPAHSECNLRVGTKVKSKPRIIRLPIDPLAGAALGV
jgi:5-methylcytosine-specific restriction endonuclease McrA